MKKLPTIFDRLFFSHLIILALSCFASTVLFFYLIGPSAQYLLHHDPLVLIPTSLLLIGITGIVTTWTAKSITRPLEKTIDALRGELPIPSKSGHEEIELLHQSLEQALVVNRQSSDASARTGRSDEAMLHDFRDVTKHLKASVGGLAIELSELSQSIHSEETENNLFRMRDFVNRMTYQLSRLGEMREDIT